MTRPAAVLFDCDGVLVDSEPAGFDLLEAEFAAHGLPLDRDEMERLFVGSTIAALADEARRMGAGFPPDWVDGFYEKLYARLAKGTALFPGVEDLLDRLDAAGIPYAVGSNGTTRKMRTTLGQHPGVWARLKHHLYSGQEIGAPKPAPDLYLMAAEALVVAPEGCVVIDDSATGCRGGLAAGMRVIGFAPGHVPDTLAALGVEIATSMADVGWRLGL
ncbi:HAD family phosphatase [uncultured Maritimibacter sp.]|uniref:HAD family hydrolase n=1 Tax=uncultured Maritimibacter sp. TaxID=991866 RepID=UPI00259881C8|nr:HAD family phosphatase [uncultured Maritimibacter sp.]